MADPARARPQPPPLALAWISYGCRAMSGTVELADKVSFPKAVQDGTQGSTWNGDLLRRVWQHYGRKAEFDVHLSDWSAEEDLMQLLKDAKAANKLEAWPNRDVCDENGNPMLVTVRLRPSTVDALRQETRQPLRRQVTIEGKEIDLRNGANHEILGARIEDLASVTKSYLSNLRNDPEPKVRRASQIRLHKVLLLRGGDFERHFPELRHEIEAAIAAPWKPIQEKPELPQ